MNAQEHHMDTMTDREFQVLILTKLEHIERALQEAAKLTEQTRARLYGNGVPGLIQDVSEIRKSNQDLQVALRDLKSNELEKLYEEIRKRDKIAMWLMGTIGVLVIGLLWAIFVGEVKIVPIP